MTASNASGTVEAATGTVRIAWPAPAVAGALADLVLDQGPGARTLDASGAFAGAALAFGVAGAGASVDPATGLVSIPLGAARAAETVTVTATNSGGSASVSFAVTIVAALPGPAIGRMGPPRPVEGSLRSSRLALTLAAAPDAGGAVITGYDLRFAQSPTSEPTEGDGEPSYEVLADVGPEVRLVDLAPGGFVQAQSRAVTEAGPGPWSASAVVALPAVDTLTFRDTFTTGTNGAVVNASGRMPDLGAAWRPFPGGGATLDLIQPAGRATHGGSSISLSPRAAKVMVFDGGFWAGTSGTLEVDFMIGSNPGERANLILSAIDGSAYVRLLMRNQSADTGRFQIWVRSTTRDGPVVETMEGPTPTLVMNSVNTLRLVRDGSSLRFSINGIDEISIADVAGLPSGTLWGVGGDSSNGNPAWLDDVRFSDMPAPPAAPLAHPSGLSFSR